MVPAFLLSFQKPSYMTFHKLKALVVEDESAIRLELINALDESPEIEVAGSAETLEEAYELISGTASDMLFLDINLIGGTAFQLLNKLKRSQIPVPPVVICTGFSEFGYAQRLHNEDKNEGVYILRKPFYGSWKEHQENILDAVYDTMQQDRLASAPLTGHNLIPIQAGRQSYVVRMEDIISIKTGEKGQGKTEITLAHQIIGCNLSLSQLLNILSNSFIQINRYEAININFISLLDHSNKEVHLNNGHSCLIGNSFYKTLCNVLGLGSED